MKISAQKQKTGRTSIFKNVGIFSISLLAMSSAVYFYSPVVKTHAESTSVQADLEVEVDEVMSLILDTNSILLDAGPNSFVSGTVNAIASTNSDYGYTLALEDTDNNSDLVHEDNAIHDHYISNFTGSKTSTQMDVNTWGFSLNETDFYRVPVNGASVAIKRTHSKMATESETTPVIFGVKSGNIASGDYVDSVLFTMYVNGQDGKPVNPYDPEHRPTNPGEPGEGGEVGGSGSMQAFDCSTLSAGGSVTLSDARDSERYTVKKLSDGKCWMTENLRIMGRMLNSTGSDLQNDDTFTVPSSSSEGFFSDNENDAFFDVDYGGYYTFYTATAGWGSTSATEGSATKSICPKGWRLPTISELQTILDSYNGTIVEGDPSFGLSGNMYNSTQNYKGRYGYYWSSDAFNDGSAKAISTNGNGGGSSFSLGKAYGLAVRCVARS